MSRTVSAPTGRRYGLALVCRVWEVARSSVYATRTRPPSPTLEQRKRGPKTQWTDAELTQLIQATITTSPWLGEGYRKVWAQLRFQDIRVCKPAGAATDAAGQPLVALALIQVGHCQSAPRQDHHRPAG
jgi:hypothetical protein